VKLSAKRILLERLREVLREVALRRKLLRELRDAGAWGKGRREDE